MTAVVPSWPRSGPPDRRRVATRRAATPTDSPVRGKGIPLTVTAGCERGCAWAETGTHLDWSRLATATERHARTTGHPAMCRAEPAVTA